jgi:hypothetical protein
VGPAAAQLARAKQDPWLIKFPQSTQETQKINNVPVFDLDSVKSLRFLP